MLYFVEARHESAKPAISKRGDGFTRAMKYQLVLQLPASSAEDYDEMIEVEEVITGNPDNLGRVDGDDAGSGEMNIFILQFSEGGDHATLVHMSGPTFRKLLADAPQAHISAHD